MGQQQILIVILATVVLGITTIVALDTYNTAADKANIDAVNNDLAILTSLAQGYYLRPAVIGGGDRQFDGLTLADLAVPSNGISVDSLVMENENGRYVISNASDQEFTVTAYPASGVGYSKGKIDENGSLVPGNNGNLEISNTISPNLFKVGLVSDRDTIDY